MKSKLNLDIVGSMYRFEALLDKIFPKVIHYRRFLNGKSMEFDGYRTIQQNEDSSNIDWKASLRSNLILAKQYVQERTTQIVFIIDVGDNMIFGSQKKLKCEYSAEMIASLFHVMITSGDKVGYLLLKDKITQPHLPKQGKNHFDLFLHEISNAENYGGASDLLVGIDYFLENFDPATDMVVLISDFNNVDERYSDKLEKLGNSFDVIAIAVKDPLDLTLPEINKEVVLEDPATSQRLLVNPKIAKNIYESNAKEKSKRLKNIFSESNIDFLELLTNHDFSVSLANFLKIRTIGGGN
jgi:uncharacterized protein (DUF58 family)